MNTQGSKTYTHVIAVVEDEEDFRSNVVKFLAAQGYDVWSADSAESFYRQLVGRHTDLVIVDIGLPGEDGLMLSEKNKNRFPGCLPAQVSLWASSHGRVP